MSSANANIRSPWFHSSLSGLGSISSSDALHKDQPLFTWLKISSQILIVLNQRPVITSGVILVFTFCAVYVMENHQHNEIRTRLLIINNIAPLLEARPPWSQSTSVLSEKPWKRSRRQPESNSSSCGICTLEGNSLKQDFLQQHWHSSNQEKLLRFTSLTLNCTETSSNKVKKKKITTWETF